MKFRMFVLAAVLLPTLTGFSGSAGGADAVSVRNELEAILALDQTYRSPDRSHGLKDVAGKQEAIDRANLSRVLSLIAAHGWPRISEVGEDAALAAFLVIQHADLEVQERFWPVVRSMVAEGEAKAAWLALLTDRIRIRKNLPQVYGTQFRYNVEAGRSEPLPIEDSEHVNDRRSGLGLKPLSGFPTPAGALGKCKCPRVN